jgi:transcriptional regulator with XRE-family HTH domain/tetratricopeptide (TPR) repeat protein
VSVPDRLGARIRTLRYRRGLSQAQLAAKAGVGEKTLKRLEAGRTGTPHPDTLAAIAGALGLPPEELFALGEASAGSAADAEPSPPPAVHQLPRPPRNFTGRAHEIAELTAQLDARGATISAIQGMGGIGKTALALLIAERWSERFPDGQFYLDLKGASDPMTAAEAMLHVIRSIDPGRPLPKTEAEVASAYRSTLSGKRALLLMDNAAGREQVEPLLPPEGSALLVTSRQRFALPGLAAIALSPLPPDESRALLGTLAPHASAVGAELARLCGGLPLALSLAGRALAERPDVDPAEYAARLADDSGRLRQLDLTESQGGVQASFELSYGMLDAEQQRGLCALGAFPQHFDRAAAAAVWDLPHDAADARVGALLRLHLIESDAAGQAARYRLHDLVRLFALARLSPQDRERTAMRHARHYLSLLAELERDARQSGTEHALSVVDREWAHIRAAFATCRERAQADDEAAQLLGQAADAALLRLRQPPRERVVWCELALEQARARGERGLQGRLLAHAARAYQELGDSRRALEHAEQALAIAGEQGDRQTQQSALVAQGDAHHALGEPRQAIASAQRGLVLARELGARADEPPALLVLAWGHHVAGESERAAEYGEQTLVIARELGDRVHEATALLLLGYARQALGDAARGVAHGAECLQIAREIGDRRIEGYALLLANERSGGDPHLAQALEIAREIGDQRLQGNALLYLALARSGRGEANEAREAAQQAVAIGEATSDRALHGNALFALGAAYAGARNWPEAIATLQRAGEAARAVGSPRLAGMVNWLLGNVHAQRGELRGT